MIARETKFLAGAPAADLLPRARTRPDPAPTQG